MFLYYYWTKDMASYFYISPSICLADSSILLMDEEHAVLATYIQELIVMYWICGCLGTENWGPGTGWFGNGELGNFYWVALMYLADLFCFF